MDIQDFWKWGQDYNLDKYFVFKPPKKKKTKKKKPRKRTPQQLVNSLLKKLKIKVKARRGERE
jgi:hypothetical protein